MIFKNKLIIYITLPILSPTQFEYPSFGELEIYQWGKLYGGGGYVRISYYLCAIKILFLHNNRTTADMLCLVMDGAYCFLYRSIMEIPTIIITFVCMIHIRFYKGGG